MLFKPLFNKNSTQTKGIATTLRFGIMDIMTQDKSYALMAITGLFMALSAGLFALPAAAVNPQVFLPEGERLLYTVKFGILTAGEAEITYENTQKTPTEAKINTHWRAPKTEIAALRSQ